MNKKLYRDEYHKMIGGVCAGLAEYFDIDITVMRLIFAFSFFAGGVGLIPYIILWIVLPKKGYLFNNYNDPTVDYTVPPQQRGEHFNTPPPFKDSAYQYSKYGSDAYTGAGYKPPFNGYIPPKKRSNAGIIIGMVLIIIGTLILIDNFDLIPDFDFERIWPVVLVFIGAAFIVSGKKKEPLVNHNWNTKAGPEPVDTNEAKAADVPPASEI